MSFITFYPLIFLNLKNSLDFLNLSFYLYFLHLNQMYCHFYIYFLHQNYSLVLENLFLSIHFSALYKI